MVQALAAGSVWASGSASASGGSAAPAARADFDLSHRSHGAANDGPAESCGPVLPVSLWWELQLPRQLLSRLLWGVAREMSLAAIQVFWLWLFRAE